MRKLPTDPTAADEWKNQLKDLIEKENLHPEQVYNMDETGLKFKHLSEKKNVAMKKHISNLTMPIKVVLVLDDAPTHPQGAECERDPGIDEAPSHHTSRIIQPMDQGVIECLKRCYRRKLFSEILIKMELESKGLNGVLKSNNIKDTIYIVAKSFEEIP
ncbi:hypothetical protein PR048_020762, partial [Dryococelus australis]